jgi:hypothetical protein
MTAENRIHEPPQAERESPLVDDPTLIYARIAMDIVHLKLLAATECQKQAKQISDSLTLDLAALARFVFYP